MAKKKEFNRIEAFDELSCIITVPMGATPSVVMSHLQKGQDYLQQIYDQGLKDGFEKGCDASKKVDEL